MFKLFLAITAVVVPPAASLWSSGGGANDIFNIFALETNPSEIYEEDAKINLRPIVGILAEDIPESLSKAFPDANATSYVGASYVKWVEAAGARAAPVFIGKEESYYERVFKTMNGLVIPGGGVSLFTSNYALAAKAMWNLVLNSNSSSFPIWGTCLGFEQLSVLSAIMIDNATLAESVMSNCSSTNQRGSLKLAKDWQDSKIGRDIPENVLDVLSGKGGIEPVYNSHHKCLLPSDYGRLKLNGFWRLLATDFDKNDKEFVSVIEARDYPIWGVQFHPEKPAFEWALRLDQIPHDRKSVGANMYLSQFLVEAARKNQNKFPNREEEEAALFYNYEARYSGKEGIDFSMQQVYLFD